MVQAKWVLAIALIYVVGGVGSSFLGGEVVSLETRDERGGTLQTSLWVVDVSGDTWVRASDPEALWLERLRANPQVLVSRDGVPSERRALIMEGMAEKIDVAMREKYGRADEVSALFRDPYAGIVIRLDPVGDAAGWGEAYP